MSEYKLVPVEPVAWAKDTGKKLRITYMDMQGEDGWRPLGYIDTEPQPAKQPLPEHPTSNPTVAELEKNALLDYTRLYEYAQQHRLDYNELCRVVRSSLDN